MNTVPNRRITCVYDPDNTIFDFIIQRGTYNVCMHALLELQDRYPYGIIEKSTAPQLHFLTSYGTQRPPYFRKKQIILI